MGESDGWKTCTIIQRPSLSIEIARECPLRRPGCYADSDHLGGGQTLRSLNDYKGQELIAGVLELVDRLQPLHLSIVGGDPLERHRELQLVTSAFRPLPLEWAGYPNLMIVVSIDGLAPEHDVCRSPAMYERILKHMARQNVVIHCTVTGPMMKRPALDT